MVKTVDKAASILDPEFVIGVWASSSRPAMTVLRVLMEQNRYFRQLDPGFKTWNAFD